jgi:HEAT repeat protein
MISDLLIGLMHDRDADVRGEAARLMGELGRWAGPSAAFRLVMLLRDRMLCEVGPKDGEPDPPAPAGHAPAPREGRRRRRMLTSVNAAAADALSRIGTPALPALTSALGDRDADVRRLAAEALGAVRLGASSALPELYRLSSDSDYRIAEAAREAVRRIRGYS